MLTVLLVIIGFTKLKFKKQVTQRWLKDTVSVFHFNPATKYWNSKSTKNAGRMRHTPLLIQQFSSLQSICLSYHRQSNLSLKISWSKIIWNNNFKISIFILILSFGVIRSFRGPVKDQLCFIKMWLSLIFN